MWHTFPRMSLGIESNKKMQEFFYQFETFTNVCYHIINIWN